MRIVTETERGRERAAACLGNKSQATHKKRTRQSPTPPDRTRPRKAPDGKLPTERPRQPARWSARSQPPPARRNAADKIPDGTLAASRSPSPHSAHRLKRSSRMVPQRINRSAPCFPLRPALICVRGDPRPLLCVSLHNATRQTMICAHAKHKGIPLKHAKRKPFVISISATLHMYTFPFSNRKREGTQNTQAHKLQRRIRFRITT